MVQYFKHDRKFFFTHPSFPPSPPPPRNNDASKNGKCTNNFSSIVDNSKHYKSRYHELKRQLEELEEYNEGLAVKLYRSQKRLRRLKIERNVLLERFEYSKRYTRNSSDDSETGSDSDAPLKNAVPKKSIYTGSVSRSRKRKHPPPLSSSTASTPRMTLSASSTNTGRNGGRAKADKDPNAPKRPANAYVMYCMEERSNIKSASSIELTSGELTKMMSDNWRNMEKEKKQMYFDTYVREMGRYQREMEEYNAGAKPAAANGETEKKEESTANGMRAMTISPPATAPTTDNNEVQK